nr:hypothetical protein [Acaryochloris sp. CCMEE 5410]
MVTIEMEQYLKASEVIDWHHPDIVELAHQLASGCESLSEIAKQSFEWVRD